MNDRDVLVISRNLRYLRKFKDLTQQQLADALNIRRSSIGAYEEGRATPKYDTLQDISSYFQVPIDTLIREDLEHVPMEELTGRQNRYTRDLEGKKLRILPITVDKEGKENIEWVHQRAAAGYATGYSDPEYIERLPKFQLPMLGASGTYRAFEIRGESMLPLRSGTIIIGQYVENWVRDIKDGQTYVVISMNDGVVYKRVYNRIEGNQGSLLLRSDNPAYAPYELDIAEIKEVWKAKMYISSDFPESEMTLERMGQIVLELQQEMIRIKNQL